MKSNWLWWSLTSSTLQQCVCQLLTNLKCRFHIPDWLRDANFETSRALEKEVDKNVYTRNEIFWSNTSRVVVTGNYYIYIAEETYLCATFTTMRSFNELHLTISFKKAKLLLKRYFLNASTYIHMINASTYIHMINASTYIHMIKICTFFTWSDT